MGIAKTVQFFLVCIAGMGTNHSLFSAAPDNQIALFRGFENTSWKSERIDIHGRNDYIEQCLVHLFNTADWGPAAESKKITPPIEALNAVKAYYQDNPPGLINNLELNTSPRAWMRSLNLRELYRFKNFVTANPNLINNANYDTDDLVKARALSGIFWEVNTNTGEAFVLFSGMLVPGQLFGNALYYVYTCMHGFTDGNSNNNIAYYFVPYGVKVSDDPDDRENYVGNKGFCVTHVRHFRNGSPAGEDIDINDPFFNLGSPHINDTAVYGQRDYAVATIAGHTTTSQSLRDALAHTSLGFINPATPALPTLNTGINNNLAQVVDTDSFFDQDERLFIIGLASKPNFALDDSGLAICTNLENTPFLVADNPLVTAPLRSFRNDENLKRPSNIQGRIQEYESSLASYPGLSGGPILRCRLSPTNPAHKRCEIIGTNFGAERVFDLAGILQGFKNFINRIQP